MPPIRFIMLGGFLGAGKTTLIARLARHYQGRGLKVGVVTNDQAADLVDTNSLRAQGLAVEEVPGACFCCHFNDLIAKADRLREAETPDVILAEPVGSCTDLVATVVQPLKDLYRERFTVAPYAVLCKPSHGLRILRGEDGGGFSPKAAYIFRKQLEEADAILINRIDELPAEQVEELAGLVGAEYPGAPVLRLSAKTGQGFDALPELLGQDGAFGRKLLSIDYDTYAEGEAELGWVNVAARVTPGQSVVVDELLLDLTGRLRERLTALGGEVAHLKAIGLGKDGFGVANLVANRQAAELSIPSGRQTGEELDLIVNARVALDPDVLQAEVRAAADAACRARGAALDVRQVRSLRPGRPVPTHRYALAVP
jgi:Ni2+-binding GTPase involved in maturation of urease and hydrogenase